MDDRSADIVDCFTNRYQQEECQTFIGLIHNCLSSEPVSLDDAFGTIRMHVSTQSAIGEHKPKSTGLLAGILRVVGMMLRSRLDDSYKTNPFFVPGTGTPIVTPKVLNQDLQASSQ